MTFFPPPYKIMSLPLSPSSFLKRSVTVLAIFVGLAGATMAKEYKITDQTIRWTGSTPVKFHTGLLTPKSSAIKISEEGKIEHLEVILDMDSINVTDMNEGRMRTKLTGHLKNEDFFHVGAHPTAKFTMDRHEAGMLKGLLEIRGVRMDFSIPVEMKGDAMKGWTLVGSFVFDRQEFDINYQSGGLLSVAKVKLIDDDIKVDVSLQVAP